MNNEEKILSMPEGLTLEIKKMGSKVDNLETNEAGEKVKASLGLT